MSSTDQYRAVFDAEVSFVNGGGLRVHDFRLDVASADLDSAELAALFVRHHDLRLAERVEFTSLRFEREPHRGAPPRALVELSHPFGAGTVTYPGLPAPVIESHLTRADSRAVYAEGTEFAIDRITMLGNSGTYLDTPWHRYPDGADLAGIPLDAVADLPTVVARRPAAGERGIEVRDLAGLGDVRGHAVLLHTGWDRHWGTEVYGDPAPYLSEAGARHLVDAGARLVGIDSVNIDDTVGDDRPAHSVLLAAGIPVVEHLTGLGELPDRGARFTAAPPMVREFGTFPVRAFALVRQ